MEVEDLNYLMELRNFNWECFRRAADELTAAGKEITPEAVTELFEKYNKEAEMLAESKGSKTPSSKPAQPGGE